MTKIPGNQTMSIDEFHQWFQQNQHKLTKKQVRQIKQFLRKNMHQKGGKQ